MQIIWEMMADTFTRTKEAGSYLLFYLLALGLGLVVAWDRYGKSKTGDNWMVEEAKRRIRLWPFLFGLCSLVLVAANPVSIWILNKFTPMEGQFHKVWPLLLLLFLVAYGGVCFMSLLGEQRQRNILLLGFILLIGLAGSSYGFLSTWQGEEAYRNEQQVMAVILEQEDKGLMLAPERVLEYTAMYEPSVTLLYGKDLYTPNLDLGIMDGYPSELLDVYEAMKKPGENLELLQEMALLYDCRIVVLDYFDEAPKKLGEFRYVGETKNYLVYIRG